MGIVRNKDIVGYRLGDEIVCSDCTIDRERNSTKEKDVILQEEIETEDAIYFCDRCQNRIT
ncbi:MAG: hypothetical protein ABH815_03665 [Candidatus Omnitrophota bacterium]